MASPEDLPLLSPVNLQGMHAVGQRRERRGSFEEITTYIPGIDERLGQPNYGGLSNGPETVIIQRVVKPVRVIDITPEEQPWYK